MGLRKILILVFFLSTLLGSSLMVNAVDCDPATLGAQEFLQCSGTPPVEYSGEGTSGIKEMVSSIATKAFAFAALFAIGAIVWSGIRYTTSYGDDEKVKKAKSTAIFALIGLVLVLTSFSLISIVVNFVYSF